VHDGYDSFWPSGSSISRVSVVTSWHSCKLLAGREIECAAFIPDMPRLP
jgi:hypothetical protein